MLFRSNSQDSHPDATACRLKISVVVLDAPLKLPWDLSVEMADYLFRLEHVSADCLLTPEEELTLLKKCICDVADARYQANLRLTLRHVLFCRNRRAELRARATGALDPEKLAALLRHTPPSGRPPASRVEA